MKKLSPTQLAVKYHNPALSEQEGHVHQVWGDGEITLTKSGDLLGQRNLHTMSIPVYPERLADMFPEDSGKNSYAYVTGSQAKEIRDAMKAEYSAYLQSEYS